MPIAITRIKCIFLLHVTISPPASRGKKNAIRIPNTDPIKIKDIQFDQYGAIINVTGKTGPRTLRLCASPPSISNWLANHPDGQNPNAFLFCGIGRNNYKEM